MCGFLRAVSESGTDDGNRDVVIACGSRPTVSCHIGGELAFLGEHAGEFVEHAVHGVEGFLVSFVVFVEVVALEDGEDVTGVFGAGGVLIYNVFNLFFYFNGEGLVGFLTRITDHAVPDFLFLEFDDVDEGHATGAVAEDEDVAGEVEGGELGQLELVEFEDKFLVDSALAGVVDSGIDIHKGIGGSGIVLADGFVVDGTEDAHIEGDGVAHDVAVLEVEIVFVDEVFVEKGEGDVFTVEEMGEAVAGAVIILGGTETFLSFEVIYLLLHIGEDIFVFLRILKSFDDFLDVVGTEGEFEFLDNLVEGGHVPVDLGVEDGVVGRVFAQIFLFFVPFFEADMVVGGYLAYLAFVRKLVVDSGRFAVDG